MRERAYQHKRPLRSSCNKNGSIIGHYHGTFKEFVHFFEERWKHTLGGRWYSADVPQGGLEIPCTLLFKGKAKSVK